MEIFIEVISLIRGKNLRDKYRCSFKVLESTFSYSCKDQSLGYSHYIGKQNFCLSKLEAKVYCLRTCVSPSSVQIPVLLLILRVCHISLANNFVSSFLLSKPFFLSSAITILIRRCEALLVIYFHGLQQVRSKN